MVLAWHVFPNQILAKIPQTILVLHETQDLLHVRVLHVDLEAFSEVLRSLGYWHPDSSRVGMLVVVGFIEFDHDVAVGVFRPPRRCLVVHLSPSVSICHHLSPCVFRFSRRLCLLRFNGHAIASNFRICLLLLFS